MIGVAGALSLLESVTVLFGWWLDIAVLKSIDPDWVSIKPNTALSFGLIGVALMLTEAPRPSTSRYSRAVSRLARVAASILGSLVVLLALTAMVAHLSPSRATASGK